MSTVHVVPLTDLVTHAVPGGYPDQGQGWLAIEADVTRYETGCACTPSVEHVPNTYGPDGWLVTHHSLDGREHRE